MTTATTPTALVAHWATDLLRAYRRHTGWLNAVQAHIDSLPRKTIDGAEYPDHDRYAEATVAYPSLRRMPGKSAKHHGYDMARRLASHFGITIGAEEGTLGEWRTVLTDARVAALAGYTRLPAHPRGCGL